LLGLKTAHRRLFEDITWSTEHVAAQTLQRAREIALDMHTLAPWYDVDDVACLRRLRDEIEQARHAPRTLDPQVPNYPTATAALIERLRVGDGSGGFRESVTEIAADGA
jgi:uncharacterized protein